MAAPLPQNIITNRAHDWLVMSIYFGLVILGWLMVYSANYHPDNIYNFLDFSTEIGRQSLWVVISMVIFIVMLVVEWNFWNSLAVPIYLISMVLLVLVLFFGDVVNGNKSWFNLGFMSFQPAEIGKFATSLALSSYMSFNKNNFKDSKVVLMAISIFMVPMLLILLQPDAGSALVFVSFFILLYRKGLNQIFYILALLLLLIFIFSLTYSPYSILLFCLLIGYGVLLFIKEVSFKTAGVYLLSLIGAFALYYFKIDHGPLVVACIGFIVCSILLFNKRKMRELSIISVSVVLISIISYGTDFLFSEVIKPHQQERINIWLRPERCDPRGPLYNLIQSKLAIGSGGFWGKGFLNGEMTNLNYVPEQSTDFVFSIVGEEQGFLGTASVIILFFLLVARCIIIAERAKLEFIRNYAYCMAGIFFIHFFINIGMTMGLMPIIGIPLPFVSRGGTSLLIFSVMTAVLIKMDAHRFRT